MKHQRILFALIRLCMALILGAFVVSCNHNNDEPESYNYLIDHHYKSTYPLSAVQLLIGLQVGTYPEMAGVLNHAKHGIQVYTIEYKTHYKDSVITASGLICMPSEKGSYPVISFQNGTNASHQFAPSVDPETYVQMGIMASNGYVFLISDYIGFGSSSEILHPYYHKESTNNAVIDLIRAFNELSASGKINVTGNDSLFLMGYSQGGEATISVCEELGHDGSLDMDLIAVSAGGGCYDLTDFTEYAFNLETYPAPMYFPYFIYSHMQYGSISGELDIYFNEPFAGTIPGLFDGSHSINDINMALSDTISVLFQPNFITNYKTGNEFTGLRQALSQNSIHGWNTTVPVNLYHGTGDLQVPFSQSDILYHEFLSAGSDPGQVQFFPIEGLGHGGAAIPWGILTINWFNELRE